MALGKIPHSSPRPGQAATAGWPAAHRDSLRLIDGGADSAAASFGQALPPVTLCIGRDDIRFIRWPKPRAHVRGTAEVEGLGRIFSQWPWGRYPIAPRGQVRRPPPAGRRGIETHSDKSTAARIRQRPVSVSALPPVTLCIGRDDIPVYSVAETSRPRQGDSR